MAKKKGSKKRKVPGVASRAADQRQEGGLPWLILGLLTVAIGVAAYLGWTSLQSGTVAGCGPESGCGDVLASRWSSWFGVPVSLLALPFYGILFCAALGLGKNEKGRLSDPMLAATLGTVLVVVCAAVWFTGIQAFVIKKFCPWCLTAHAAGLCGALLIGGSVGLFRATLRGETAISMKAVGMGAVLGCLGLTLLFGGQLVYQPDTFEVATLSDGAESEEGGEASQGGELSLHGGRFQLKVSDYPLIGKSDAGKYMLSLFDYTCRHCRATHPKLKTIHASFSDDLAIVSLPMPLNGDCNSMMRNRETHEAHRDACHYASLSLSVFRLKPEVWAEFDDWLFKGGVPPTIGAAVSRAAELVGDMDALQQTMQSSSTKELIELAVKIYEVNARVRGQGSMPQLLIGNAIVTGEINDLARLYGVLAAQLGLRQ